MKAKDLAKLLNVSPATISLLLNDKPGLSQSLRDKLTAQIIELGLEDMLKNRPSSAKPSSASGKRKKRNDAPPSIAYISYKNDEMWDNFYSFYNGVLEGAQQEATEVDLNLSVIYRQAEKDLVKAIHRIGHVIGAIIICDEPNADVLEELAALEVPCVFIDQFDPNFTVNSVNVDNRQSQYMIVKHLKENGHRDIGYVSCTWEDSAGDERFISFRRAMKDLHLRSRQEWFFSAGDENGPLDSSILEERFRNVESMPTALIAQNDLEALRTVNALKHCGYRVPEDISVVGFDDNPISRVCEPPLTTVRSSRHRIGRECVAMIQRLVRLNETDTLRQPMKISISTELVIRDSVKDRTKG